MRSECSVEAGTGDAGVFKSTTGEEVEVELAMVNAGQNAGPQARIGRIMAVDIPRPRSLATTFEPHFVDIVHELREHISEQGVGKNRNSVQSTFGGK